MTICCVETSGYDYPLTQRHIPENWISQFLGEFAKLRKATISSVMSVYPSVCPHRTTRLPMDGYS